MASFPQASPPTPCVLENTFCRNVKQIHAAKKSVKWRRLLKISVSLQASNRRRSLRQATRLASSWIFRWFNLLKVILRTAMLDIQIFYILITWNLCVFFGSQKKKQQILPYATLKYWIYDRGGECLLCGTHEVLIKHRYVLSLKCLTLRLLMSYIYGAPILDVSRSHTTTQHSR